MAWIPHCCGCGIALLFDSKPYIKILTKYGKLRYQKLIVFFFWLVLFCFVFLIFKIFCFFAFKGCRFGIWKFPDKGSNWSYSCQPVPQSQQHWLQTMSVTYTIARSNARSLTHWGRPEAEATHSWMLVRFLSAEPQQELP